MTEQQRNLSVTGLLFVASVTFFMTYMFLDAQSEALQLAKYFYASACGVALLILAIITKQHLAAGSEVGRSLGCGWLVTILMVLIHFASVMASQSSTLLVDVWQAKLASHWLNYFPATTFVAYLWCGIFLMMEEEPQE